MPKTETDSTATVVSKTTRETTSVSLWPHFGCARGVADRLAPPGGKLKWTTCNPQQERFVSLLDAGLREMADKNFSPDELRYRVTDTAAEMNRWFKEEGFEIALSEAPPPAFYAGSVMKVSVRWWKPGTKTELKAGKETFPAAYLKEGVQVWKHPSHQYPVVYVRTKSGDQVYMTPHDAPPADPFELTDLVMKLSSGVRPCGIYEGVVLPFVDYDEKIDVSWLVRMQTQDTLDRPWAIAEAVQQTKFKMNHRGARVESAAGWGMRCLAVPKPPFKIDRPFLLWMQRDGLSLPIFTGYFTEDVWKDPGEIDLGPDDDQEEGDDE